MKELNIKPRGVASEMRPKLSARPKITVEAGDDAVLLQKAAFLVATGMELRTEIHQRHLVTGQYAEHKALNEYYDEIVGLVDDFAETMQGRLMKRLPKFPKVVPFDSELPQDNIEVFRNYLDTARDVYAKYPELQSIIDNIQCLNSKTMYLLTMR